MDVLYAVLLILIIFIIIIVFINYNESPIIDDNHIIDTGLGQVFIFDEIYRKISYTSSIKIKNHLYQLTDPNIKFENALRLWHNSENNFTPLQGYKPFVSVGSVSVLQALMFGLLKIHGSLLIIQKAPAVFVHKKCIKNVSAYGQIRYICQYDISNIKPNIDETMVEIVTSPNNPSFEWRESQSSANIIIVDRAYDSMPFVKESQNKEWINRSKKTIYSVFSMTKSLGHAGERVGFVWIPPKCELRTYMHKFVHNTVISPSVPGQLSIVNALGNLNKINKGLKMIRSILKQRHNELSKILTIKYFNKISIESIPGSAYFWFKIIDRDVRQLFMDKYKLSILSGTKFYSTSEYGRMNLMIRSVDFNMLLNRISSII